MQKKPLNEDQIEQFIQEGFVCIDEAFPKALADEVRAILWKDIEGSPDDPSSWKEPVVRLGYYHQEPFRQAANTAVLHAAYDQLVGKDQWLPLKSMGSFPIRFPSTETPADDGWHVDAGFEGEDPHDYLSWRINIQSQGRALLMLFLFSDVQENDAPTRLRKGSHLAIARMLHPHGARGLSFMELAAKLEETAGYEEILACGEQGTVYLCHPFLVHAAQAHRGSQVRFMAQPGLIPVQTNQWMSYQKVMSPVAKAIQRAYLTQNE